MPRYFDKISKFYSSIKIKSLKSKILQSCRDTFTVAGTINLFFFLISYYVTPVFIGITAVQLVGVIVWLIIEPPDTTEIHPYPLSAVLTCRVSTFSLMMSLVYNMFLILMCTLYAFKTRKIPENFNEAKYIGFTMYSTCIVWLAFVPIYFGSNNDYKVGI